MHEQSSEQNKLVSLSKRLFLNLQWFHFLKYKLIYHKLKNSPFWASSKILGFAPANDLTAMAIDICEKEGKKYRVFDLNTKKKFTSKISHYSNISNSGISELFILSTAYADNIKNAVLKSRYKEVYLFKYHEPAHKISLDSSINLLLEKTFKSQATPLYKKYGNTPLIIVNTSQHISFKNTLELLQKTTDHNIICYDYDKYDTTQTNFQTVPQYGLVDIIDFLKQREKVDNIIFFTFCPMLQNVFPILIRSLFPKIKIVLNVGDWLPLLCTWNNKHELSHHLADDSLIKSEFIAFESNLSGLVDGIINTHDIFSSEISKLYMQNFPGITINIPCYLNKRYNFIPTNHVEKKDILFVSGHLPIFDKAYPDKLFADNPDPELRQLEKQNLSIDVYLFNLKNNSILVKKYNYYYKDTNIKVFPGLPIEELIEQTKNKYKWGYAINPSNKEHFNIAIPSKLFVFLCLGIPIICTSNQVSLAKLIQKENIGLVIKSEELDNILPIMNALDYPSLQSNVIKYRERCDLKFLTDEFSSFLTNLIN